MRLKSMFAASAALAMLASAALAMLASAALAGPLPYYNQPLDTPNSAANAVITVVNSGFAPAATTVACTGTTTATCSGLKTTISITGLTTAAATLAAAVTVTNTSVAANSMIYCATNVYAGTGIPIPVNVIPGAGSFTFQILNVAASGALNATVPINCMVYN